SSTSDRFTRYLEKRAGSWARLMSTEGAGIPLDLQRLYNELFARLPELWARSLEPRFRSKRQMTLIHGDAYFCNFLTPRAGDEAGPTYVLDWQSPSFDIGGYDLVNLLATFWTSEQRRQDRREERALRRYLETLRAHGVRDYDWSDLVADYQL